MAKKVHRYHICFVVVMLITIFAAYYYYHLVCPSSHELFRIKQKGVSDQFNLSSPSIRSLNSAWLESMLDQNVNPFWTRANMKIEEDTYAWWRSIQNQIKDVSFHELNRVLEELFTLGIPDKQELPKDKIKNRLTCAVVGNSGNLKGSKYGASIDDHNIIIRFNKAPTKGYEEDVGSRTTYQIMYPESAIPISNEISFTLLPIKPLDVLWLLSALTDGNVKKTYQPVPSHISCNISKIAIISPGFIRHVYKNCLGAHGKYPSTGAVGVAMAIQICDKIDVYGFGADRSGSWQHYWETLSDVIAMGPRKTTVHDGDKEKEWLQKLSRESIIDIHMGVEY